MPKCSLRQLLSRATSRRNGPASVQLPFFGGNGTWLGGGSVLPWGFGQRQDAGFLSLLYAYLFPYFLSLHYTFLSFPLYISVKTPPEVFYSTTRCLQRKPGTFYCKMSRLESLPSAVQHEERTLNKEKLKPTHGKAREDGQEVPTIRGMTGGWGASQETARARSW